MKELLPVIFMLCLTLFIWSIQNHLIDYSILLSLSCVIVLVIVIIIWNLLKRNN